MPAFAGMTICGYIRLNSALDALDMELEPGCKLLLADLARAQAFLWHPPGPDWAPINTLEGK